MSKFIIQGGKPLTGTVAVSGSKNAALPILAATLLTPAKCRLHNVPDVADVHLLLKILQLIGAEFSFTGNTVEIQTRQIRTTKIPFELASKMRASILLLGPLLARAGRAELAFPGGCVIGKRQVQTHLQALSEFGARNFSTNSTLKFRTRKLAATQFTLPEMSVTATENALMLAASLAGRSEIKLGAREPHVQNLIEFLQKLGARIENNQLATCKVQGRQKLKGAEFRVTPDYLEAGTLTLAAVLTRGRVKLKNICPEQLELFWQKLREVGAQFSLGKNSVEILPTKSLTATEIKTAVFPGFPTDLQAPFAVLLTRARGKSRIFETLFEGRLNYLFELEKMGARVEMLNPQQAVIFGGGRLRAASVTSCDLRAGAAIVLAALAARGVSEITNIEYIERGYEHFAEKLRKLGAEIRRVA